VASSSTRERPAYGWAVSDLGRLPATAEDHADLESALNHWLNEGERAKWPRALQYFENASYLVGNHLNRFYYTLDRGFGVHQFGVSDTSAYDALLAKTSDNKLIRPVETVASMLTQSRPMGRVEANSELPEDEDAAALAEIVLDVLWEKPLNLPARTREAALLGCIASTAVIEVEFGPTYLPVMQPKLAVQVIDDEFVEGGKREELVETGEYETTYKSDIQARLWSFFHITPDPVATSPDDMQWVARTSFEDVAWVREVFDQKEEGYFPENLSSIDMPEAPAHSVLYWWSRLQDIIDSPTNVTQGGGMAPHAGSFTAGYAPGQTKLTVVDVRPTSEFPQGRTIILAGSKLIYAGIGRCFIEDEERPGNCKYPHRWHPYAFWGWFKLPGRFWHAALVSQILPMQKKINAIDVLVHANRQYMAIGQWKLPKHSKVPDGMPSGTPGEHLRYQHVPGMSDPEPVDHRPLPGELMAERAQLERSIELISASGSVDSSQVSASAARANSMLGSLREEKLRSKSPMIQEFEAFIETICQNILIEVQHGLRNEDPELTTRIRRAAREYSDIAVQTFTGASLRDHHSIKIDIASELLKSTEADASRAMEYTQFKGGQLTPQETQGVLKAIGMDKFVKNPENDSVRVAKRLISRIVSGQVSGTIPEQQLPALLMRGVAKASAMLPVFQRELLSDRFDGHEEPVKSLLLSLFIACEALSQEEMMRDYQLQMMMAQGAANAQEPAPQPGAPSK
jgi:hypothetical protein